MNQLFSLLLLFSLIGLVCWILKEYPVLWILFGTVVWAAADRIILT